MLRCLLDLFSLLNYFSLPNLKGLKRANTCEQTQWQKRLPGALVSAGPLGLSFKILSTAPCFEIYKRFWGVSLNYSLRAVTLAIISTLADVLLLSLCCGFTSLPLLKIPLPSGRKPQEQSLSLLKPFFLPFLL